MALGALPDNAGLWHRLALVQAKIKQYIKALESIRRAAELSPNDISIGSDFFRLLVKNRQFTESRKQIDHLLSIDSDHSELLQMSAALNAEQGAQKAAGEQFSKAFFLTPSDALGLAVYRHLTAQQDLDGIVAFTEHWANRLPENTTPLLIQAQTLTQSGNIEGALKAYHKALAIDPTSWLGLNNIANLFLQRGDYDKAVEYSQKAYEYQADNASVMDTYGWALFKQGKKLMMSLDILRKATTRKPNDPGYAYHFAEALSSAGRIEQARSQLRRALDDSAANFTDRELAQQLLTRLAPLEPVRE